MSHPTYDYIIIGAGAAGCVLANRLSADPATSVLLLEAGGGDLNPFVRIPAGFAKLMGTKANWCYDTEPQRHMNDRSMFLPQGKLLGGSTSVNAMLYIRGNRGDYDGWRDLGNKGWGYDDVLPYFTVHENNERLANEYHGTTGELNVADQIQHNPTSVAFMRAAQQAGIRYTPDPNGEHQEGVFYHQVTQRKARRESAASAFLRPIQSRSNLTVHTHAEATRIVVDKGRAVGLEYLRKGSTAHQARARLEVIVSSGAINSPKLLLNSGIGPADELSAVGVDVVHDLPGVGKNLHDQLEVYTTREAAQPVTYSGEDRWYKAGRHALQYGMYRTGPATATITEAGAFVRSQYSDVPDVQLHFLPAWVVWEDGARTASKVPGHGVTLLACNVRPQSRGEVKLRSSDPRVAPTVDPNYLAEESDVQVAIDSFRIMRDVLDAPAFRGVLKAERMPGASVTSAADLRDYIKKWGKTDYHPVGTCKMGIDDAAVVDPELRVHGLSGLRVIDSSIMPSIISGNTQAPSMMIGEKGAALVLESARA